MTGPVAGDDSRALESGELELTASPQRSAAAFFRRLFYVLLVAGFLVMFGATLAQVLFRYALHLPASWTEEVARIVFIASAFLGIAVAVRDREHIEIDYLPSKLPARVLLALNLVLSALVLALLLLLTFGAGLMSYRMWGSYLPMLDWFSNGYLYLWQTGAFILMMVFTLAILMRQLAALFRAEPPATSGPDTSGLPDRDLR